MKKLTRLNSLPILFLSTLLLTVPAMAEGESSPVNPNPPAPAIVLSDRITMEFQGVSIYDVLKVISKRSGLNIVTGKNVQGQVSMFLQDVPVREALKTILQSQNLASIEENGIIKIMTEDEFLKKYGRPYEDTRITRFFRLNHASAEALASKLQDIRSSYGKISTEPRTNTLIVTEIPEVIAKAEELVRESDQPQQTEVFRLDYTSVEELEPKLKTFMEGVTGRVEMDKRSNRIVVSDIPSRVEQLRTLIEAFDVRTPQVLIDAKIVEVQLSDANRKGINWRHIMSQVSGDLNPVRLTAPLTVAAPTGAVGLATLTLGSADSDTQIVLDLLERVGKTNLLSSPRITVMNNEEANLAVATREPFVSQTVVQTTNSTNTADNVQFVDVGVTLKVQPKISRDRVVLMKIKPEVSSSTRSLELEGVAQGSNTTFTRTRIPVVTTQGLETTVQIKSGNTLVIGGLIQDTQSKQVSRVPVLGSLPLVGAAFQSNADNFSKTELVIFLTPQILEVGADTQEDKRFILSPGKLRPFDAVGRYATPIPSGPLASKASPYWERPEVRKGTVPSRSSKKILDDHR